MRASKKGPPLAFPPFRSMSPQVHSFLSGVLESDRVGRQLGEVAIGVALLGALPL